MQLFCANMVAWIEVLLGVRFLGIEEHCSRWESRFPTDSVQTSVNYFDQLLLLPNFIAVLFWLHYLRRLVSFGIFWMLCSIQVEKIHSNNSIPSYLIQEGRQVIRLRSTLQGLMERCSHISSELETFISDLASKKSVDSLDNNRSYVLQQPCLLTSRLLKYFHFLYTVCAWQWLHRH